MDEKPPNTDEQSQKDGPTTPKPPEQPAIANTKHANSRAKADAQILQPSKPSGFWSNPNHWIAIASVVMAVSSGVYTYFALQQWATMQRQLTDYETREGADLVIGIDAVMLTPQYPVMVQGKLTVTNRGNSVAREIYFQSGQWISRMQPTPREAIPPITLPSGPSLAPNDKPLEYDIGAQIGNPNAIEDGTMFFGFDAWAGYKTIFGVAQVRRTCFMYYTRPHKFLPCPTSPHIEKQK